LPHVVVEYSANLAGRLDLPGLMKTLRDTAIATGIFPLGGTRVRAYRAEDYLIADGHPDNTFVHIVMRIGHGRDLETRRRAGDAIFEAACANLATVYDAVPLGISFEIQEIGPELAYRKNNLHEYVKKRQASGGSRGNV
jgi:5-carboxymethyl-2-hydroxymuconate isomerase